MGKFFIFIITFFVIFSFPFYIYPQSIKFTESQFDIKQTSLKPGFIGNNFQTLYKSFSIQPRGEFETTEQYETRKAALPEGVYAFSIPQFDIKFEADKQEFLIKLEGNYYSPKGGYKYGTKMLLLKEKDMAGKSYIGSNAFGVTKKVKQLITHKWGLIVSDDLIRSADFKLKVATDSARQIKKDLKIFVVTQMDENSIPDRLDKKYYPGMGDATGFSYSSATIQTPVDLTTYYYGIETRILCFIAYDKKSGSILGKYGPYGREKCDNPAD